MQSLQNAREEFACYVGKLGGTAPMAREILRHARLLHRWAEEECGFGDGQLSHTREDCAACGGSHVRYRYPHPSDRYGVVERGAFQDGCASDRQRFAGKRATERIQVLAALLGCSVEFSGDPRGCVVKLTKDGREMGVPS